MGPSLRLTMEQERPSRDFGFNEDEKNGFAYKFARWCAFQATALKMHIWKLKYLFFKGEVTLADIDNFDRLPIYFFRKRLPDFVDKLIIYLESKRVTDLYFYDSALSYIEDKLDDDKIESWTGQYYIYETAKKRIEELNLPEINY